MQWKSGKNIYTFCWQKLCLQPQPPDHCLELSIPAVDSFYSWNILPQIFEMHVPSLLKYFHLRDNFHHHLIKSGITYQYLTLYSILFSSRTLIISFSRICFLSFLISKIHGNRDCFFHNFNTGLQTPYLLQTLVAYVGNTTDANKIFTKWMSKKEIK